ncbi:MAG: hypothetical protein KAV87_01325 [Desulfobacteraceae bacterium]|nr:hypothetical protein [Desulfobacteraceae bacterium]
MASTSDIEALREKVLLSLKKQGFIFDGERIRLPKNIDKEGLRQLHWEAVQTRRKRSEGGLVRHEFRLLSYIASGTEVVPDRTLVHQLLFAIYQVVKCAGPTSSTCSTLIFSKTP